VLRDRQIVREGGGRYQPRERSGSAALAAAP